VLLASSCDEPSRTAAPNLEPTTPRLTAGQGSTPTFIGQATYADVDKVKRRADDWQVELKAKGGLEVVVRSFAYEAGSYTGWHRHPGPVLIQVVQGTVTFFEADAPCTPIVVRAGEGYLDNGEVGHIGRNLSGAFAKDVTIYLAPPGTQVSQLRVDMPAPKGAEACS
jgi:quercetin dioxygenase-like cupin family protein